MRTRQSNVTSINRMRKRQINDKLLLVVAGTYDEFLRYRDQSPRKMRYITDIHTMYGLKGTDIVKIGSWYNRDDADDISKTITQQRLNEVHV